MRNELEAEARRQLRLPFDVAVSEAPTNWPFGSLERAAYEVIMVDPP
jgi:hypothetical protein